MQEIHIIDIQIVIENEEMFIGPEIAGTEIEKGIGIEIGDEVRKKIEIRDIEEVVLEAKTDDVEDQVRAQAVRAGLRVQGQDRRQVRVDLQVDHLNCQIEISQI